MSAPWVGGTVEGVAAELRKAFGDDNPRGDTGRIYAAAIGMITGLAHGYTPGRTDAENLADIRTVVAAVDQLQEEIFQERNPGGLR